MGKMYIEQSNFTQVSNNIINDNSLSYKAKGIYLHLVSKPNGWDFYIDEIVKSSKDGKESVQSGLKELESAGYLKRTPAKSQENGKFTGYDYYIYNSKNRQPENPVDGETQRPENTSHSNTNNNNTDLLSNTEYTQSAREVVELWNKITSSNVKLDVALGRKVTSLIRDYGWREIKETFTRYHNSLNSAECWYSTRRTLFEFLGDHKWGFTYFFHATPETLKKREPKKTGKPKPIQKAINLEDDGKLPWGNDYE